MLGTSTERRAVPHNLVAAVPVAVMPLLARLVMVRIIAREGIDGLRNKAYCLTCECPCDGHSYPAQSRRRVVSPCTRAVVRSRSRMAVNMDRTYGIARFSLSATGR
jgi:hypothetical protein